MPCKSHSAQKQLTGDIVDDSISSQQDINAKKVNSLKVLVEQQAEQIKNLKSRNAELRAEVEQRIQSDDDILVTALMHAAADGNMETVKYLIEDEATLQDRHGKTAIMYASFHGYNDIVELLFPLEGAIMDNKGHDALYYALKSSKLDTAKYLIHRIASTDQNGATALMRAVVENDLDMVRLLIPIQKGMQTTSDGEFTVKCGKCHFYKGTTALMLAIRYNYLNIAKELLEHEKGKKDCNNWTALMWAAHCGCTEILKDLVESENGVKSLNGWTALMLAAYNNHIDATKELAKFEATISANDGCTALDIATKRDHKEIITFLSTSP